MEMFATGENETRIEAAWVLFHSIQDGTPEQIRYLVELNIIPPLCEFITLMNRYNIEIVEESLLSLYYILKLGQKNDNLYAFKIRKCGGFDKIESLKSHQNKNISRIASLIVETFFNQEKDKNSIPQVVFF